MTVETGPTGPGQQPANAQALNFSAANTLQSTSLVGYQSRGHCLVIAQLEQGLDVISRLAVKGKTLFVIDNASTEIDRQTTEDGIKVITARAHNLRGYLGAFDCEIGDPQSPGSLAKVAGVSLLGGFDTVLDLSEVPLIDYDVPPFGYYAAADNPDALRLAMEELPDMEGEFEKPKYFDYDASICAHSRSGITACTNCVDVCSTGAITSAGDGVLVEPYLCQGCGSCASSCPSGAMKYAYPKPSDAMSQLSGLVAEHYAAGNQQVVVLLHDAENGAARLQGYQQDLDASILPLSVEEVASIGMDGWFCALAYGASAVVIDAPSDNSVMHAGLKTQLDIANNILEGIGHSNRLHLVDEASSVVLNEIAGGSWPRLPVASFKTFDDKRQTIRMALDHLTIKPTSSEIIDLSSGSPFGRVIVNKADCTLCLACVTVCPARALQDGETLPQLKFIESSCLQCGLCEKACPEDAISLEQRYLIDSEQALKPVMLNEEKPFNCIVCNTAFATERIIGRMQAKLSGHWMFEDEKSMRRLKMCEDCRVKDIFQQESGIDVHKS